jgi:hypothetical protein
LENFEWSGLINYIGLLCLLIVVFWDLFDWRKRKKEGTFKEVEKDSWWKQTYFWQIFIRRAFYRPCASSFPYLIFILPAVLMMFGYIILFYGWMINGKAKTLEEMQTTSGIVTKVYVGKGKNSYDYIRLKDDIGNEEEYKVIPRFFYSKEKDYNEAQEFRKKVQITQKTITIWYENDINLFRNSKILRELKIDNQFITLNNKIKFKYDYEWFKNRDKNAIPNFLWWINYSLLGWAWIWFLNKKELPIHRLNRKKYYKKYNLKDKK